MPLTAASLWVARNMRNFKQVVLNYIGVMVERGSIQVKLNHYIISLKTYRQHLTNDLSYVAFLKEDVLLDETKDGKFGQLSLIAF